MKTTSQITLDADIKALAKTKRINISDICNKALRSFLLNNSTNNLKEKIELSNEINDLEQELIEIQSRLLDKKAQLSTLEEREKQTSLKDRQKSEKFATAVKNSGLLNEVLD